MNSQAASVFSDCSNNRKGDVTVNKVNMNNIRMFLFNDINNPKHEKFAEVIKKLKNEESSVPRLVSWGEK